MCDYSIHVASRPAQVGDRLETKTFGTGTIGFCGGGGLAICLLPGTEVAFDESARLHPYLGLETFDNVAIFRQVDKDNPYQHHDCLEFPDGRVALLASLDACQWATVLQLPAAPQSDVEREEQRRAEYARYAG